MGERKVQAMEVYDWERLRVYIEGGEYRRRLAGRGIWKVERFEPFGWAVGMAMRDATEVITDTMTLIANRMVEVSESALEISKQIEEGKRLFEQEKE